MIKATYAISESLRGISHSFALGKKDNQFRWKK